jgi:flagellin
MSVINTNVNAVLAQNALVKNERSMSSAMEQLSTGKRINGAKDDAAGLAIASKMTSQIRGLDQAVRNVNDAISMIQTAEGATVEITNMLQRMRELAVQSSSGTNTADDRANIEAEFNALRTGIDNVANTTQWNKDNILEGSKSGVNAVVFQIGANDSQTMTVDLQDLNLNGYAAGTIGTSVVTTSTGDIQSMTSMKISDVTVNSTALLTATDVATLVSALNADSGFAQRYLAVVGDAAGGNTATALWIKEKAGFETATGPVITTQGTTNATTIGTPVTGVASKLGLGSDISALTSTTSNVITTLDNALRAISTHRGNYGAAINRLEYTADNLANVSQNTQASRSRIEDADYAKATTELARTQIIQQAGTAMLAQANQQSQGVLALLQ